jgi:hypothetical protein
VVLEPGASLPEAMAGALVDALAAVQDVKRSRVADAGTYSYRFAELADVLVMARPILHEHGLAHMQPVSTEMVGNATHVSVCTELIHVSGATATSPVLLLVVSGSDAQRVGSAVTYARRYSLMATLGIAGDDDDAAMATLARTASPPGRAARAAAPATGRSPEEAQARELLNGATSEVRTGIQRAFREHFGVSLSNLSRDRHAEALSFITEQLAVPDEPDA